MLHVILTVLKIIGIILLVILALILLLILSVLFVPIRYRAKIRVHEDIDIRADVGWLAYLVKFRYRLTMTGRDFKTADSQTGLRILGIAVGGKKSGEKQETEKQEPEDCQSEDRKPEDQKPEVWQAENSTEQAEAGEKPKSIAQNAEQPQIAVQSTEQSQNAEQIKQETDLDSTPAEPEPPVSQNLWEKICITAEDLKQKILSAVEKLKAKIQDLLEKKERLQNKLRVWYDYLTDVNNRNAVKTVFKELKKFLSYIKPNILYGRLIFGLKNPADTGMALGLLSVFYSRYVEDIQILPDFQTDRLRLETDLTVKGRIRLYRLLIIVVRLYRNKEFRSLLDTFPR